MRLFIAEKPEVAKEIAKVLGKANREDGFIEVGNDLITWAYGHLLEMCEPHEYDQKYKKWDINDLPFSISEFKYQPKKSGIKQLKIIKNLIKRSDVTEVINAGDIDEEGQILIEEILNYCSNNKPVKRILLSDLTEANIKKALENIKDNNEFKGMSEKGFARSQADWWVGMNLTRAYTLTAQKNGFEGVLSVGRVQTPILSLVVNRDLEHENFKSGIYYSVIGEFSTGNINFFSYPIITEKIEDEEKAQQIKKSCEGKSGKIIEVNNEEVKELSPLPYNLLNLQADCSSLYGYKPDDVLKITQELREQHKLITYNRSDSQYLPENMHKEATSILKSIKNQVSSDLVVGIEKANPTIKSRAFDDNHVTAHHGIIPTLNTVNREQLTEKQKNVYDLICKNYILQFYNPREVAKSIVILEVNAIKFKASSRVILNAPFDFLLGKENKEKENEEENNTNDLRDIKVDDAVVCKTIQILKNKTKPKPYYKMSTLLKDLTSIAKYVKDERIKKLLVEKDKGKKGEHGGIGTPATRSEHIKTLFSREYVYEDKKKNIISTAKGREIIRLLPSFITSPDMTALWYEQQEMIQRNELTREQFLNQIKKQVAHQIEKSKNIDFRKLSTGVPCPECKIGNLKRFESKVKKGKFWWGCSNIKEGCQASFFDDNGKPNFNQIPKKRSQKNENKDT